MLLFTALPGGVGADDDQPFARSGFAAAGAAVVAPARSASVAPAASLNPAALSVGGNVDVIAGFDVTQQAMINGTAVSTCNPGMYTAQNETPIAVNPANPKNLVGGANDYRLYEPSENRYDGSGGFYTSTDGGASWTAGFLPGLVRANSANPGPYESAGDPAPVAGPDNTFWYANLAFNRSDAANSVAVSRSTDGGATWTTSFVIQTPASQGAALFNDKEWIGADPTNSNVAYVTWTQFHMNSSGTTTGSDIVISKTTDGGASWSPPVTVSRTRFNQGSVVAIDTAGVIHVTYEGSLLARDYAFSATSTDGGVTFSNKIIGRIDDIPSPLPGGTFRTNSFPAMALDGTTLHVVWSNWNGTDADVVYTQSTNGGANWSKLVTVAGGGGDQFFPWVGAQGGKVFVSYLDRPAQNDVYGVSAVGSADGGATWAGPTAVATAPSDVTQGNLFGFPNCAPNFIGDYTGIAVGSDGVAHSLWTDIRAGNDHVGPTGANQDPETAPLTLP